MNLYFQYSDGSQSLIAQNVQKGDAIRVALDDLNGRNPNFKTYYQRTWTDDNGWYWIDVGSWSEFYILRDEEQSN